VYVVGDVICLVNKTKFNNNFELQQPVTGIALLFFYFDVEVCIYIFGPSVFLTLLILLIVKTFYVASVTRQNMFIFVKAKF
jgi:hypothetical protein